MNIALVTFRGQPGLTADDQILAAALRRREVLVTAAVWDDPAVEWQGFDLICLRSPWDYFVRYPEFLAWLDRVEGLPVWNSVALARWNLDKRYLGALAARGIPTVPTRYLAPGDSLLEALGDWDDAVVKPVVSASAYGAFRTSRAQAEADQAKIVTDVLVQPFVPEIAAGEWSIVFFDGAFSHAVLKTPASGDYRVQGEHGGRHEARTPPERLVADAERVLMAMPERTLYARVDGCDVGGLLLMEIEVVEPMLFFGADPLAAERCAEALITESRRPRRTSPEAGSSESPGTRPSRAPGS